MARYGIVLALVLAMAVCVAAQPHFSWTRDGLGGRFRPTYDRRSFYRGSFSRDLPFQYCDGQYVYAVKVCTAEPVGIIAGLKINDNGTQVCGLSLGNITTTTNCPTLILNKPDLVIVRVQVFRRFLENGPFITDIVFFLSDGSVNQYGMGAGIGRLGDGFKRTELYNYSIRGRRCSLVNMAGTCANTVDGGKGYLQNLGICGRCNFRSFGIPRRSIFFGRRAERIFSDRSLYKFASNQGL